MLKFTAVILIAISALTFATGGSPKPKAVRFGQVEPILKRACAKCHSGAHPAHRLDLTSYERLMKGDHEGVVVVRKNAAKSRLAGVLAGHPEMMPPAGALPKDQIAVIQAWINQGARK